MRTPWVVGVSGASGTPYARAVLGSLLDAHQPVDLIVSRAARLTILDETGLSFRDAHWQQDLADWLGRDVRAASTPDAGASEADRPDGGTAEGNTSDARTTDEPGGDVRYWAAGDLAAGPSSGSYRTRGMVVVPASTAAVAGIAIGLSKDLLQRAADVTLKERRPLVIVPRETPYTRATLQHLLELHDAGATVLPASPGFYSAPKDLQQLVDFVAAKVLDAIGVEHDLITRWTGELGAARDR